MEHDLLAQKRTAYALGELDAAERAVLEADLLKSEAHRLEIEEVRALAAALSGALANEKAPGMLEIQHLAIESTLQQMTEDHEAAARMRLRRQRIAFWVPTALAACALLASGITLVMLSNQAGDPINAPTTPRERVATTGTGGNTGFVPRARTNNDLIKEINALREINPLIGAPAAYGPNVDTVAADPDSIAVFHPVAVTPLSSFPLLVDTTVVPFVQRFIQRGMLPPRETVHVDAMINAFAYEDAKTLPIEKHAALAIKTEVSECPWNAGHKLARVLIRAQEGPDGTIVAQGVGVRVEFNPTMVASYRLIGYENRKAGEGVNHQNDEVDLKAGYTLTAMYEIVPQGNYDEIGAQKGLPLRYQKPAELRDAARARNEWFNVVLSYRTDENPLLQTAEAAATDPGLPLDQASQDFKFAAAVAQFGLALIDPPTGGAKLDSVRALAKQGLGADPTGDRARFIRLIEQAQGVMAN